MFDHSFRQVRAGMLLAIGMGLAAGTAAYADEPDLIGHWTFDDGTATDVVGGNHGTVHGNATTAPASPFPTSGGALDLGGAEDYVTIELGDWGEEFTFTMWIRPHTQGDTIQTLLGNDTPSSGDFRLHFNNWNTDNGRFRLSSSEGRLARTTTNLIQPPDWQHVAVRVNRPEEEAFLYHNGEMRAGDRREVYDAFVNEGLLYVGTSQGENFPFLGDIDDLRHYAGLLSEEQVAQTMIPEPTSLGLLAAGGLLMLHRRRRQS